MFKRIFKKKQPKQKDAKPSELVPPAQGNKLSESKSKTPSEADSQEQAVWEPSSSASRNSTSHELSWSLPFRRGPLQSSLLPAQDKEDEGKLCLVLDMDETLIHCAFLDMQEEKFRQTLGEDRKTDYSTAADHVFEVSSFQVEVRCRPGLKLFLEKCAKVFELVVFTASLEEYATKAMDLIDPDGLVKHRLYRPATVTYRGVDYVKDLSRLGRDMQRIVLIDNNHLAMLASPENSIAINDFMGDPNDSELFGAYDMLMTMKDMTDVRPFIRDTFRTHLEIAEIFEQMEIADDGHRACVPGEAIPLTPASPSDLDRPVQVYIEEKKGGYEEKKSLPPPPPATTTSTTSTAVVTAFPSPIQIPRPTRAEKPTLEIYEEDGSSGTPKVLAATYSHQFATPMRTVPRRVGQLPPVAPGAEGFSVSEPDELPTFQLRLSESGENHAGNTSILARSQEFRKPASEIADLSSRGVVLQEVGL